MRTLLILLLLAVPAVAQEPSDQSVPAPRQYSQKMDWPTWATNWNQLQYKIAHERAHPDTILEGYVVEETETCSVVRSGGGRRVYYSEPFPYFPLSDRYTANVTTTKTVKRTPQRWVIRGYGGGPVMIYNPYVPRPIPEQFRAGSMAQATAAGN
jgi:hypothetical protein